jgi:hypothetical protein
VTDVPVIRVNSFYRGFFAELNILVSFMHAHQEAVVYADWRNKFCYADSSANNWFRYFEEIPVGVDKSKMRTMRLKIVNVSRNYAYPTLATTGAHSLYIDPRKPERVSGLVLPDNWRDEFGAVFSENLVVKDSIWDRVSKFWDANMSGLEMVGVHLRNYPPKSRGRGGTPPLSDYFTVIDSLDFDRLFVATDNYNLLNAFKDRYGNDVVYQKNVFRDKVDPAVKGSEIHKTHGYRKKDSKGRKIQGMGEDVLTDALLLARCTGMVHIESNLATAVGFINPDIEMVYLGDPLIREEYDL